ncbi:MAG: hypothetical protein R2867_37700 [Caldilineaceae bacterium]
MRQLAVDMTAYEIGCVETERTPFYERLGRELWRGALADRNGDELLPTLEQKDLLIPHTEPTRRLT